MPWVFFTRFAQGEDVRREFMPVHASIRVPSTVKAASDCAEENVVVEHLMSQSAVPGIKDNRHPGQYLVRIRFDQPQLSDA